jgi:ring-1,2-phenylacetyl-CoA epoxidase subunit PaaD
MTAVTISKRRSTNPAHSVSSLGEMGTGTGKSGIGSSAEEFIDLIAAVESVPDPELGGVTIGELGLVHELRRSDVDAAIEVTLLPTFLGCPALNLMERDVVAILRARGVSRVRVTWANSPSWSPNRISEAGRVKLAELGIAVPVTDFYADGVLPVCPICSVTSLVAKLPVGPTACRSVAWCTSCRSVVEIMRGSVSSFPEHNEPAVGSPESRQILRGRSEMQGEITGGTLHGTKGGVQLSSVSTKGDSYAYV